MHLLAAADMSVDIFVDEDSELWLVQLPDPKKVQLYTATLRQDSLSTHAQEHKSTRT